MCRALDVFTKGHRSTSADVPKNLTANVFNNHFLSVSESVTEPRTNVYECSNPLHDFCKENTSRQDPFVIQYFSVKELFKYISRLEKKKIVWSGWYKQPATKIVIIDSLTYVFNLCIDNCFNFFFHLNLKKPKWFRFQKSADKTNPTNYRPILLLSVLSKLLEKQVHIYFNDYSEKQHAFSLDLDVNTPATLYWHVSQILG